MLSAVAEHRIYLGHHSTDQNNKLHGQLGVRPRYIPMTSKGTLDSLRTTPSAQTQQTRDIRKTQ
jgi:hypothetical protein